MVHPVVQTESILQETYDMAGNEESVFIIQPSSGLKFINWKELFCYRDTFRFLVLRDIKIEYAQTILGLAWAIIQPLIQVVIFTIIFGNVAKIRTGEIPYVLFAAAGIIPWDYLSQSLVQSCNSLIVNQYILSKIYFPRIIYPMIPVASKFLNFGISLLFLFGLLLYYNVSISWSVLYLPVFIVNMVVFASGVGIWLSSLTVRYRDVKVGTPFLIRLLIYSAPVVYPISSVPERYQMIYALNPIVSIVEGFRSCLLGTPISWSVVALGFGVSLLLFTCGVFYFKSVEHLFVDVI